MNLYLRVAGAILAGVYFGTEVERMVREQAPEATKGETVGKLLHWGAPVGVGITAFAVSGMLFGGGK